MSIAASVGEDLVRIGTDIMTGNVTDAVATARALFDIATGMIPAEDYKQFLKPSDKTFDDLEADVAEEIKLADLKT